MSKERMRNSTHIEGLLYQHRLEKRVTGDNSAHPGTEYIRGTVDVATDDAMTNIVTVFFNYVTAVDRNNRPNESFTNLSNIIAGTLGAVMDVGAERATKLRIDSAVGVNDFYSDRSGTEELISVKRNEGGFVRVVSSLSPKEDDRSTFDCDMIITNVRHIEADEDRDLPAKAVVGGYVFNFRKEILPVEFSATNPGAIRYFENLNATETDPVFTRVRGKQISNTVVRKFTEESAFGDPIVRESTTTRKDYVITWAQPDEYTWDDPSTYTVEELKEAKQNREVHLAETRARMENNSAFNNVGATATTAKASSTFEFNF